MNRTEKYIIMFFVCGFMVFAFSLARAMIEPYNIVYVFGQYLCGFLAALALFNIFNEADE